MTRNRAKDILHVLQDNFSIPRWTRSNREPFKTLIVTVLSQATTDKNAVRAFKNLSSVFPITPEALAKASVEKIENAIRVGGLYKNKSRVIKAFSRMVMKKFNGSLDFVYSLPFEKARRTLLSFPGVGPKTADVVLLFCAGKPTIPVDTHVNRVSKRLGLTPPKADYEKVRQTLEGLYEPENYLSVHLLFILLGRECCKARKTLCSTCPTNALCPSRRLME